MPWNVEDDSILKFEYPIGKGEATIGKTQRVCRQVPIYYGWRVRWGERCNNETVQVPNPDYVPNRANEVSKDFNYGVYTDWAHNYVRRGNSEHHKCCQDNITVHDLRQVVNEQNDLIRALNNYNGNIGIVNDMNGKYDAGIDDYNKRIAALRGYLASLPTFDDIKSRVYKKYDILIKQTKDEKARIDRENVITIDSINNNKTNTMKTTDSANDLSKRQANKVAVDSAGLVTAGIDLMQKYYDSIKTENSVLEGKIEDIKNFFMENDRQSNYREETTSKFVYINFILFWAFYAFVFLFLIMAYYSKTRYELIYHLAITIIIGCYPLYIYTFEKFFYGLWTYFYSIINGIPYNADELNDKDNLLTAGYKRNTSDDDRIQDGDVKQPTGIYAVYDFVRSKF